MNSRLVQNGDGISSMSSVNSSVNLNPSIKLVDDEMEDFVGQAVVLEAEEAEVTSEQT